jgi:hypothetical protein
MKFDYQEFPLEMRKKDISDLMKKYPDRVPVYIQSNAKEIILLKNKILIHGDITVGQLLFTVRSKIKIASDKAMYILDETGNLPMTSQLMSDLYKNKKNIDGCLYLSINVETTFG